MVGLKISSVPNAGVVNYSAGYTLFVEGNFDEAVLGALLGHSVQVKKLGSSMDTRGAARALFEHHPEYFFIIDRDHFKDADVEKCWQKFPDPKCDNLLMWHLRELENYFLDPDYLMQSNHIAKGTCREKLKDFILQIARGRLYFDIANLVIVSVREALKENWIKTFEECNGFDSRKSALVLLLERPEFGKHAGLVSEKFDPAQIERKYDEFCTVLTGGMEPLTWENGMWRKLMSGKEIFGEVVSHSGCFSGFHKGSPHAEQVARELVANPGNQQPDDFLRLKEAIEDKIKAR